MPKEKLPPETIKNQEYEALKSSIRLLIDQTKNDLEATGPISTQVEYLYPLYFDAACAAQQLHYNHLEWHQTVQQMYQHLQKVFATSKHFLKGIHQMWAEYLYDSGSIEASIKDGFLKAVDVTTASQPGIDKHLLGVARHLIRDGHLELGLELLELRHNKNSSFEYIQDLHLHYSKQKDPTAARMLSQAKLRLYDLKSLDSLDLNLLTDEDYNEMHRLDRLTEKIELQTISLAAVSGDVPLYYKTVEKHPIEVRLKLLTSALANCLGTRNVDQAKNVAKRIIQELEAAHENGEYYEANFRYHTRAALLCACEPLLHSQLEALLFNHLPGKELDTLSKLIPAGNQAIDTDNFLRYGLSYQPANITELADVLWQQDTQLNLNYKALEQWALLLYDFDKNIKEFGRDLEPSLLVPTTEYILSIICLQSVNYLPFSATQLFRLFNKLQLMTATGVYGFNYRSHARHFTQALIQRQDWAGVKLFLDHPTALEFSDKVSFARSVVCPDKYKQPLNEFET